MKLRPTDGATVLARWKYAGKTKSRWMTSKKFAALAETQKIKATARPQKFKVKTGDKCEPKLCEQALDEAIENTFPASDPISAEQPV